MCLKAALSDASLCFLAYGLKCYQCFSFKDWDDCDKNKTEETCSEGRNRCGKGLAILNHGGVSHSSYGKGCATSSDCDPDKVEMCKPPDSTFAVTECEINCCSGDLCNGAKVPMVSAIMLLACVLVAFLR